MMDYAMTGFDMGIPGGRDRPPTPKYEPPSPAAKGFTRSPGEDEIVVCPNCGDELAVGDDELKQEIWVVKGCGHVSAAVTIYKYREGRIWLTKMNRHIAANAQQTEVDQQVRRARVKHHFSTSASYLRLLRSA